MPAEPLIFPRGVRYPSLDEIPDGAPSDAAGRIEDAQRTPITTGYKVTRPPANASYDVVIEANVHAPAIWDVFCALVHALLPAAAAPIVGALDEETILGAYTTRDAAVEVLAPFRDILVHDGFLEFGCIFQRGGRTEEVFVPTAKFLRIWTSQLAVASSTLEQHGIAENPALRFIDEFPLVREAQPFGGTTSGWWAVLNDLRPLLASLPLPPDVQAP